MPLFTVEDIAEAGLNATYNPAAAGGDAAINDGRLLLHVKNAAGTARTVTIAAQDSSAEVAGYGTMTKADAVVAVPASEDRFIGPFPKSAFNDPGTGQIAITYDDETSVTVAALRLP